MSAVHLKSLKKLSDTLSVLYVEDDLVLRESTADLFKGLFKRVDLAENGERGLELYKEYLSKNKRYYDIVISDIQMPVLNGIEMSRFILEINKEQKIIIMSAHEEKEYLLEVINIGVEGFIQKPLSLQKTIEVLHRVCVTFHFDEIQYFNALTEASIVSKSDTNGIITYVNDNFCKITGYSREEMLGRSHNMFRHPSNPDELYREMWKTISSGNIWRERMLNLSKDGSEFIAESTIIPLVDSNGVIKEYMAIRNDITEMVKYKREVNAREQDKIEQKKISEAQKSFLVVFTHELKTPLNAIINFSKYIKKHMELPTEPDKKKLISLLESVLNNANDMLDNVTQILEISKLNAGKLSYSCTLFNVADLISSTIDKYDSLISEKQIKLIFNSEENIFIDSDEYRVKQIISNILSNAIKYGKDKIIITLSSNDHTTVSIEDNGPGIKDKEAIFGLYTQEDDSLLQRKGQGTGIGLHFIKLLCSDLDISYKVEDASEGHGTKFSIIFADRSKNLSKG